MRQTSGETIVQRRKPRATLNHRQEHPKALRHFSTSRPTSSTTNHIWVKKHEPSISLALQQDDHFTSDSMPVQEKKKASYKKRSFGALCGNSENKALTQPPFTFSSKEGCEVKHRMTMPISPHKDSWY